MAPPQDREELRKACFDLLGKVRMLPTVDQAAFELFELILARLDRIETGVFSQEETPTRPEKRTTSPGFRAPK